MQWQHRYPQEAGVYWFWGGSTEDHPSAAPQIVEVWGDVWHVIGEGSRYYANECPGFCAGPLLPPSLHMAFPVAEELGA